MPPVPGVKPKPDGQKVNRVAPTHDWVEVLNVPYEGEKPNPGRLPAATKHWWDVVSSLPHCILWEPGDWQFAVDTARIHAAFSRGELARAQELRVREKAMGTTMDARRDLRIRYIDPEATRPAEMGAEVPDNVTEFSDDRRRRLSEGD